MGMKIFRVKVTMETVVRAECEAEREGGGMIADVERVEMVESAALPTGSYQGRWCGRTVRLLDYTSLRLKTGSSIGDLDVPCVVKVNEAGVGTVEFEE